MSSHERMACPRVASHRVWHPERVPRRISPESDAPDPARSILLSARRRLATHDTNCNSAYQSTNCGSPHTTGKAHSHPINDRTERQHKKVRGVAIGRSRPRLAHNKS
eukprot:761687-Prymnesium_polylepis.1